MRFTKQNVRTATIIEILNVMADNQKTSISERELIEMVGRKLEFNGKWKLKEG